MSYLEGDSLLKEIEKSLEQEGVDLDYDVGDHEYEDVLVEA